MQFKILKGKKIIQGISETCFGSINPIVNKKQSQKRALKFLKKITKKKISSKNLIFAKQIFSSNIHVCQKLDSGKIIKNVDGLISNIQNQVLAIVTGDCLPVLFFDPKKRVVGIIHGSRKCLIRGIIDKAIKKMNVNFQSQPRDILVAIGPHIRKCHYWLKEKTLQNLKKTEFKKHFFKKNKKIYFDLTKLAFEKLIKAGIKRKNIEDCNICTFCFARKYFSVRKKEENPDFYNEKKPTFASFIGLKSEESLIINSLNINQAKELIKKEEVIVFPTDTVYGLIADATSQKAVSKIFKIKKRDKNKSLPIFIKNIKVAKKLAFISPEQEKILKKVWPGKTTVILKKKPNVKIYGIDKKTIALRIPKFKPVNFLLEKTNLPLIGTSANISGKPASFEIEKIIEQFKNQKHQPSLIFSKNNLKPANPSKIIDLTGLIPKVLRK